MFTTTTELSCGHKVLAVKELGISFVLEDFHTHWHWDRYIQPAEPVLEPLRVISYTVAFLESRVPEDCPQVLKLQKIVDDDAVFASNPTTPGLVPNVQ